MTRRLYTVEYWDRALHAPLPDLRHLPCLVWAASPDDVTLFAYHQMDGQDARYIGEIRAEPVDPALVPPLATLHSIPEAPAR